MFQAAACKQPVGLDQRGDDGLVGVALLALVVDDAGCPLFAVGAEARRILGEIACIIHGEGDDGRDAACFQITGIFHPGVKVLATVAGRGVDETGTGIVSNVIASQKRHSEVVTATKAFQRMCAGDSGELSCCNIAQALVFLLDRLIHLLCRDDGEVAPPDPDPGNGRDLIDGGAGNDVLYGQDDDDTITGGEGDDYIDGGIDEDLLSGGAGSDTVIGGQGNDTISGDVGVVGDGADDLFGGIGDDLFVDIGQGDTVTGGEDPDDLDVDVLDLRGVANQVNPGGTLTVEYDVGDPEAGIVRFFDSTGTETGTTRFSEIENVIPCFTPGTMIATATGERAVEELAVGDRVITRDNGIQAIRWVGRRDLTAAEMARASHLRPVRIRAGALGNGLPERDLLVSPNHRILIANEKTSLYFDDREVLVAAKHLIALDGVDVVEVDDLAYIHIMFDQHEVVLSDGAWTESFQPGDQTLAGMDDDQRDEIFELFPDLRTRAGLEGYTAARRSLKKHEAQLLVH